MGLILYDGAGTRGIAPLGFPGWALAVLEIRLWQGEGGWSGIKNNLSPVCGEEMPPYLSYLQS